MAPQQSKCVKCSTKINTEKDANKLLKCSNNNCDLCMHFTCSDYKPSELKFLETNKPNIRWYCGLCVVDNMGSSKTSETSDTQVSDLCLKFDKMEQIMGDLVHEIRAIRTCTETQGNSIFGLENTIKLLVDMVNKPQPAGLKTRSATEAQVEKPVRCDTGSRVTRSGRGIENPKPTTSGGRSEERNKSTTPSQQQMAAPVHADLLPRSVAIQGEETAKFSTVDRRKNIRSSDRGQIVHGKAVVTRVPVGTGIGEATFAAVARRAYLYVGNANLCATEETVSQYLLGKFPGRTFIVEALPTRQNAQSRAFKLTVDYSLLTDLLSPEVWPDGILVKKFFRLRTRENTG